MREDTRNGVACGPNNELISHPKTFNKMNHAVANNTDVIVNEELKPYPLLE